MIKRPSRLFAFCGSLLAAALTCLARSSTRPSGLSIAARASAFAMVTLSSGAVLAFDPVPSPCGGVTTERINDVAANGGSVSPAMCPAWSFLDSSGTFPQVRRTAGGIAGYYLCKGSDGRWNYVIGAVSNAELAATANYQTSLVAAFYAAAASSTPKEFFDLIAAQRAKKRLDDPEIAAAWCPIWPEVYAAWTAANPPPPPPGRRVVAAQTFLLSGGTLIPLASKAPVGALCTCPASPPVIASKTYCTFPGAVMTQALAECR